jgi:hypothetical protein
LSVVHRVAYEHGLELVMGHLLVPLRSGLFEFRVIAANKGPTGIRESQLFSEALAKAGVKTHEEAQRLMRSLSCRPPAQRRALHAPHARHSGSHPAHPA